MKKVFLIFSLLLSCLCVPISAQTRQSVTLSIESWQVANDRQKIFVKLFGSVPENAYICLVSLADGSNQPSEADATSSDMRSIDISNLPAGNYAITYIVDGVTIDQKKIQL